MTVTREQFKKMSSAERKNVLAKMELKKEFAALPSEDRKKINELLTAQRKDPMTQTEAAARGAAQGLTFGFADEIAAGMSAAGESFLGKEEFKPALEKALAEQRARDELANEKFPKTFIGSEVAGAVGVSLVPFAGQAAIGARAAKTGSVLGKIFGVTGQQIGKGVGRGIVGTGKAAAGGALTELGKAEDKSQPLETMKTGALFGGTVGAGASLLGPIPRTIAKAAIKAPGATARVTSAFVSGGKSEVFRAGAKKALQFLPEKMAKTEKLSSLKKVFEKPIAKTAKGAEMFVDALGEAFEKQGAAGLVATHTSLMQDPKYIDFLNRVESLDTKGK